jgi:hypothetical protein
MKVPLMLVIAGSVLLNCATTKQQAVPEPVEKQPVVEEPAEPVRLPLADSIGFGTYAGSGMQHFKVFVAPGPWNIDWIFKGQFLGIVVYREDGEMYDVVANIKGDGAGNTTEPQGGTYSIKIESSGEWELTLRDAR